VKGLPRPRLMAAWAIVVLGLPLLTTALKVADEHIHLPSVLLLYLLLVVAVAALGGALPATAAALGASALANWYFTPPFHRLTIGAAEDAVALTAFVVVAAVVSGLLRVATTQAAQAKANEIKAGLLAGVSHDLRTPLASIKASVTSLQQDDIEWSAADRREFLATIDEEADRLDGVVGNLLDMSRITTGSVRLLFRGIGFDEVVPAALAGLGDRAEAVVVDVPESLPRAWADPGLLERVVANVVDNAIRWSAGAPVRLEGAQRGAHVELRVIDHGPGVPAEQRPRLFESFQRLGDTAPGGVGLGLAVARGFMNAMGGAIDAEDTPGGGLTMVLRLPWELST
jgi:two-component system sensor histidine kinase KdpD